MTLSVAAADGLLPKKKQDFLPVDEAFELQPLEVRDGALEVSWRIAQDYYLYRDRLKFTLAQPAGTTLGTPVLPASEKYHDEHFGTVEVFRHTLRAKLPLAAAAAGPYKLTVVYQGCADAGLCYPPQTRTLEAAR
jgi:thiol:disulfide interchange protein DsbD